jgi:hypothetical protein
MCYIDKSLICRRALQCNTAQTAPDEDVGSITKYCSDLVESALQG